MPRIWCGISGMERVGIGSVSVWRVSPAPLERRTSSQPHLIRQVIPRPMWIPLPPSRISISFRKKYRPVRISSSPSCFTTSMGSSDGPRRSGELVRRSGHGLDGADPGAGVDVPIIPGLMPIQNYASFRRLINLCKCPVPKEIIDDLDPIKVRKRE